MKISDYINTYHEFSALTSTVARQLIFSGIALIWIFKIGNNGDYSLSIDLLAPIMALLIALSLDLGQYLIASIIWYFFYRYHEEKRNSIDDNADIEAPVGFTYIINAFFILKIIFVIVAYYYLIKFTYASIKFI